MSRSILCTVIGFGAGAGVGATYIAYKMLTCDTALDKLKNALLTLALMTVSKKDVSPFDFDYQSYDGTHLPAVSGCSVGNRYFSYIINKLVFRVDNVMYSDRMMDKLVAIDRYLDKNLGTSGQVMEFFGAYATLHERILSRSEEVVVDAGVKAKDDCTEEMDDEQYDAWLRELFARAQTSRVLRDAIVENIDTLSRSNQFFIMEPACNVLNIC
jgi:hypothetical protein